TRRGTQEACAWSWTPHAGRRDAPAPCRSLASCPRLGRLAMIARDTDNEVRAVVRDNAPTVVLTYDDIRVCLQLDGLDDALRRNTIAEAIKRTVRVMEQHLDRYFGAALQAARTNTGLVFDFEKERERLANSLKFELTAARAMKAAAVIVSLPEPTWRPRLES